MRLTKKFMKKEDLKRYLISSLITFLASFLLVIATSLQTLNVWTFDTAFVLGILTTAFRAGVKALVEYLIPLLQGIKKQ